MSFITFRDAIHEQLKSMSVGSKRLFYVDAERSELWNVYLNSFHPGTNPFFRKRTEHDCAACRHFIRQVGNVVAIRNGEASTIWDIHISDTVFDKPFERKVWTIYS